MAWKDRPQLMLSGLVFACACPITCSRCPGWHSHVLGLSGNLAILVEENGSVPVTWRLLLSYLLGAEIPCLAADSSTLQQHS